MYNTAILAPFNIIIYWDTGIPDSFAGDYVMLYLIYIINKNEIEYIAKITINIIN
jgi:hypothetical protein